MSEMKAGWRRVRFGEIAECVNDRVDDPSQAGVDRYVGLEHLDPESLRIRRWGTPDQVESTKLRFRPGDIIFGKRRAYQRKLAVADFEGICSAHAMVLRARPGPVVPEFLPFFMRSDTFMERAQAISVGSLSPTINWKTLAAEEFALPSLEEQQRLADLLVALRDAAEAYWHLRLQAEALAGRFVDLLVEGALDELPTELLDGLDPDTWTESSLGELCTLGNGHGFRPTDWSTSGMPIIRIQNVRGSTEFNYYAGTPDPRWVVNRGELLFAWAGVPGVSFGPGIWDGPPAVLNQHIYRVTPREGIDKYWLYEVLRYLTPRIERRAHGFKHSLLHIRQSEFKAQRITVPPLSQQLLLAERISAVRDWTRATETRQHGLTTVCADLLRQL